MKRHYKRIVGIGIVAVGSLFGISQAHKFISEPTEAAEKLTSEIVAGKEGSQSTDSAAKVATDPFASSHLLDRVASREPAPSPPRVLPASAPASAAPLPGAAETKSPAGDSRSNVLRNSSKDARAARDPFGLTADSIPPANETSANTAAAPSDRYADRSGGRYDSAVKPASGEAPLTLPDTGGRYRDVADTPLRAPAAERAPAVAFPKQPRSADITAPGGRLEFAPSAPDLDGDRRRAAAIGATRGTGQPGSKQLEGPQSPHLTLAKKAPEEIQVGKPATFQIAVKNTGSVPAHDVRIHDTVPQGTRLLGSKPRAETAGGQLVWSLGTLEPGDEKLLEVQLMPEAEGEIGSVASITFRSEASVRTVSTRPQLTLEVTAPRRVMIGDDVTLSVRISNPGTGEATGIVLFESLPAELKHPSGNELEFEVGDLSPKETREIELVLTAARRGVVINEITARGDGSLTAQSKVTVEVIAPELKVGLDGPKRRYLERKATYVVTVTNPGTAPAKDVELVSHLPKGMKFVSANNAGHYDEASHSVLWSLEELPEGESGSVKLVILPIEAGAHKLRVESRARQNLADEKEETIQVEGLAALFFEVADVADPVEVGGDTMYEIRVLNQGTKSAKNIRLVALLPPQLKALSADGPTRSAINGGRVIFEPLARLAPKADTTYRVRIQGLEAGDQRVRIQLQSDEMTTPVTKEESTRVYSDR